MVKVTSKACTFLWIFLIVFMPNLFTKEKAILVLFTCFIYILDMLIKNNNTLKCNKALTTFFIIYVSAGILSTGVSTLYNDKPFTFVSVKIIYPIIFFIIILYISSDLKKIKYFYNVLIAVSIITMIFNIFAFFLVNGFIPFMSIYKFYPIAYPNYGVLDIGVLSVTSPSIIYSFFTIPFFITVFFAAQEKKNKDYRFLWFTIRCN